MKQTSLLSPQSAALLSTFLPFVTLAISGSACRPDDYMHVLSKSEIVVQRNVKLAEMQRQDVLDVLWVIDNSGSMSAHQANVIRNTATFMQEFTQRTPIRWKMGLISTSDNESPYVGFTAQTPLNYQTADPVGVFQAAVSKLRTNGLSTEKFFEPVLNALDQNPGFLRPDSLLAMIVVTDAPEQSDITSTEFLDRFSAIKPLKETLAYGIVGPLDFGCSNPAEDSWNYAGSPYESLITTLHGNAYPLCKGDFSPLLSDIAQDIMRRVSSPWFYLQSRPVVSSIHVIYGDREIPSGPRSLGGFWTYDPNQNAVVFSDLSFAPGDDEEVRIDYTPDTGV